MMPPTDRQRLVETLKERLPKCDVQLSEVRGPFDGLVCANVSVTPVVGDARTGTRPTQGRTLVVSGRAWAWRGMESLSEPYTGRGWRERLVGDVVKAVLEEQASLHSVNRES